MKDVVFKSVTFVENGNELHGYYFYDAADNSDYGHIFGIKGLTLPKAISTLKEKGVDAISNVKVSIKVYYW